MADPICRWRNPYVNTIVELVRALPHEEMPSNEFRAIIEKRWPGFLHTPYQLACQVGLYYESDEGIFYPRFNHDIDEDEARSYMENWIAKYYVPNPYTKSMKTMQQPLPFLAAIIGYVYEHPNETELHAILEAIFQEKIGNIDIISNVLNTYTDLIKVDSLGNVELTVKAINYMEQYINRNDKKAFFDNFSENNNTGDNVSKNLIIYGAPGTGKSHKIKDNINVKKADEKNLVFRTTFHPDSDYSTFVGCYKPGMKSSDRIYSVEELAVKLKEIKNTGVTYPCHKFAAQYWRSVKDLSADTIKQILVACGFTESMNVEISKGVAIGQEYLNKDEDGKIIYTFTPQAFTNAYVKAWNTEEDVYLIIEEINRGNCAQIFGDLFQLLDRKNGVSEYPIDADADLANYISKKLESSSRTDFPDGVKEGKKLVLPSNLYIWATMNTSDQSLFPIDSAFKRRWDWMYIPIKEHSDKNYKIEIGEKTYDWWGFLERINKVIGETTSSEDKKLGYFFVKTETAKVSDEQFVGKVLFYIWNDVFKNYGFDHTIFSKGEKDKFVFSDFFNADGTPNKDNVQLFLKRLEDTIKIERPLDITPKEESTTASEDATVPESEA